MIGKKIVSLLSIVALGGSIALPVVHAQSTINVPAEYLAAVEFMQDNELTSATSYERFNPLNAISREQLAAFASRYYTNVLGKTMKDDTARCSFTDASMFDPTLVSAITDACEYGLMGVGITAFMPKATVTRGEVLTVMSRMLYGNKHNGASPFWLAHEQALYDAGIVTMKHPAVDANGSMNRIFTALMMYRAADDVAVNPELCEDPAFAILCGENGTGTVTPPVDPTNPTTNTGYDNTNRPVSNGSLTLTATSRLTNGASIPSAGIVTFANMKFAASSDDVQVYGIKMIRQGLGARSDVKSVTFEKDGVRVARGSLNNDNTVEVTFNPAIVLKANGSETLDLVITLSGAGASEHMFEVTAIETNAKSIVGVGLKTNMYRTTNYQTAKTNVTSVGSVGSTYSAGETQALRFGQFKIENVTSTEERDTVVKTITLRNNGNGDAMRSLANLRITQNGKVVTKDVKFDGRNTTFVFDNYILKANQTPIFDILGDVTYVDAQSGDVYEFVFNKTEDVSAEELLNTFRTTVTLNGGTNTLSLGAFLVKGGDVMLRNSENFNRSQTIVFGAKDVAIMSGEITARQSARFEDSQGIYLKIQKAGSPAGTYVSSATEAMSLISKVSFTVGDSRLNGEIQEGTAALGVKVFFNGSFTVLARQPVKVLIDTKANSTVQSEFKNATIEMSDINLFDSFSTREYQNQTNNNILASNVVGILVSARLTLQDAGLSLSRSDSFPVLRRETEGSTNVVFFKAKLTNTSALPVTITSLAFSGNGTYMGSSSTELYVSGAYASPATYRGNGTSLDYNTVSIVLKQNQPVEIMVRGTLESGKTGTIAFGLQSFNGQDDNGTSYTIGNASSMASFVSSIISVELAGGSSNVVQSTANKTNFLSNSTTKSTIGSIDISAYDTTMVVKDLIVVGSDGTNGRSLLNNLMDNVSLHRQDGTQVAIGTIKIATGITVGGLVATNPVQVLRFENIGGVNVDAGKTEKFEIRASLNRINDTNFTNTGLQLYIPYTAMIDGALNTGLVLQQTNGTYVRPLNLSTDIAISKVNTIVNGFPVVSSVSFSNTAINALEFKITAANGDIVLSGFEMKINGLSGDYELYEDTVSSSNLVWSGNVLASSTSFVPVKKNFSTTPTDLLMNGGTEKVFILRYAGTIPAGALSRTISLQDVTYLDRVNGQNSNSISVKGKENVGKLPIDTEYFRQN